MSIFQKSVVQKHLYDLDEAKVEKAYQTFLMNYNATKIEEIKTLKEEEYQDGFLRDLFVDVLGYTLRPEEEYNLQREFKNQTDGKKADGAITDNKGHALAIIELKSTKTKDLAKVTQQAFNYKNNQPECKYVITSNFQKLRFYIDYTNEYEEFDLFQLNKERFKLLYLLLQKDSIFSGLPLQIKDETKFHEQEISDKLYKDYSRFKRKLFDNLTKNHPDSDKLTLFKKSQKLLDRFLFILFAEDSGLLPPNSIPEVIKRFEVLKENDAYKPVYEIFKQYFGYMNIGRKGKTSAGDIPAYNGGLFYEDAALDNFNIDDKILIDDLLHLSEYDFSTEVDVNILGHIFEHSLNEIEEITAEIEGTEADKTKSKRKKDGVFYTPKYITQYIVENTVGRLCSEKRVALCIEEIEFDGTYRTKTGKLSEKGKNLYKQLTDYKDWLITLKIIDPACGSGAFLNQALNFLIEEHTTIDDIIAELTNSPLRLFDVDKTILENNLFGVDINEESVEIARLSLWLRTAQKGRKLSSLNQNIKCGNSLIDDPEIAGDKAFDWNVEFKTIMDNGGFDCVIGNPPYVFGGNEGIKPEEKTYFKESYQTGGGKVNLFTLFIELSYRILKNKGEFSFIIPNTFLRVTSYDESRRFFLNNFNFRELGDLGNDVFQGAVTSAIILIATKKERISGNILKVFKDFKGQFNNIEIDDIVENDYIITSNLTSEKTRILKKMRLNSSLLGEECREMIFGVVITKNKDEIVSDSPIDNYKPFLEGKDVGRYLIKPIHQYLNYNPKLLHRARTKEVFESKEKLLVQRITGGKKPLKVAYDNNGFYNKESLNNVILKNDSEFTAKFILCLMNSSLINWYYNNQFTNGSTLTVNISKEYLSKIPVLKAINQNEFIEKADKMLVLNKGLQEKSSRFIKRLTDNFELPKVSKKLEVFYEYDFKILVAELKKQKVQLSLIQQDEWEDYFTTYKTAINAIQQQIATTDNEIDQMVYRLYELSEEEISIVENS